jgi:hypothetical protein
MTETTAFLSGTAFPQALDVTRVANVIPVHYVTEDVKCLSRTSVVSSLIRAFRFHFEAWHTRLLAGTSLLLRFAPVASTRDFLAFSRASLLRCMPRAAGRGY